MSSHIASTSNNNTSNNNNRVNQVNSGGFNRMELTVANIANIPLISQNSAMNRISGVNARLNNNNNNLNNNINNSNNLNNNTNNNGNIVNVFVNNSNFNEINQRNINVNNIQNALPNNIINQENIQEENDNDNEVSPTEVDNQILYYKYEINEEEMDVKINDILGLIEELFKNTKCELDFQLVYSKCYDICLSGKIKILYDRYETVIKTVINNFLEKLKNIEDNSQNLNFIPEVNNIYDYFTKRVNQISDLLSYMDSLCIKRKTLIINYETIEKRSWKLFYENLIFKDVINNKIVNVITRELKSIRNKNFTKMQIFIHFINIVTEDQYGSDLYKKCIYPLLKKETNEFYIKFNENLFNEAFGDKDKTDKYNSIKNYMLELNDYIYKEEELFNNLKEKNELMGLVYDTTILKNYDSIFQYFIKKLFKLNEIEIFSKVYEIFFKHDVINKEEYTNKFINSFNIMLSKILNKKSKVYVIPKTGNNSNEIEYLNFYQYIDEIYNLKVKCQDFLKNAMQNNQKLEHIIKNNFEKIINNEFSEKFSFSFAKLIHEEIKLCQKIKNNDNLFELKDKFNCIFKLINNKDLFEVQYRILLSKRLLRNSSMMKENESIFYEIMKQESGINYIKKIEKMINDIFYSQNINYDFHKQLINNNIKCNNEEEFYIKLLTHEVWPFDDYIKKELENNNPIQRGNPQSNLLNGNNLSPTKANMCLKSQNSANNICISTNSVEISSSLGLNKANSVSTIPYIPLNQKRFKFPSNSPYFLDLFEKYFQSKFPHRYLTYIPSLCWSEIYSNNPIFKTEINLIASFYQVSILLMFKKKKLILKIKNICEDMNISEEELEIHYQQLVKVNLLIKVNNEELKLNTDFCQTESKINVNYKGKDKNKEDNKKNKEISHFILEDRKYQIDAAIISHLKKYKNLQFNDLFTKLKEYLKTFFVPEEDIVISRLKNLEERNLIKLSNKEENIYSYVL